MQAVKRGWLSFRYLPMVVQVVTWVVIGFLVVGLFSGSQGPDTDTAPARRSTTTTTQGPTTTDAEATTTSSTTSSTTTAAAPTTTSASLPSLPATW